MSLAPVTQKLQKDRQTDRQIQLKLLPTRKCGW